MNDPAKADEQQLARRGYAERQLSTTTKSKPQTAGISSRWLPWVQVAGGAYRVNRRLTYVVGDGRVTFVQTGMPAWRGVPMLPCSNYPVLGDRDERDPRVADGRGGRWGHRTAPDRHPRRAPAEPVGALHGHLDQAIISYLVTAYYSVAVLTPDALGVLEDVAITR